MTKINYVSTASFCVENARELGLAAAILLDKIVRLSKYTTRQDGFCWYTAKQFEEETSLSSRTFDNAARKLEECGIVERKITYIIGTMTRATHFKLTKNEISEPAKFATSVPEEIAGSVNTINNTINMPSAADAASGISSKEEEVLSDLPFDEDVIHDVRTKSDGHSANVKAAKILKAFGEKVGLSTGGSRNKEVHRIKQLLDDGKTEDEILYVAEWSTTDDFYKDASLMSRLSADAFDRAEIEKKRKEETKLTW